MACLPVYRTYPASDHAEADRRVIETAATMAERHLDAACRETLSAITALLTGGLGSPGAAGAAATAGAPGAIAAAGAPGATARAGAAGANATSAERTAAAVRDEFVIRFQQLVSPVVAKGVEDTALYRWSRLVSLNDVGGDPDHHEIDVASFHEANRRRAATWPHTMLATSTHDNKRSEYVRLRINAISEDPAQWQALVARWSDGLDRELNAAGLLLRPTRGDRYLLFQTLVGSAPFDASMLAGDPHWPSPAAEAVADYAARIKAYMFKAGREAKRRTSWLEPDDDYEQAVARTIDLIFASPDLTRQWLADIRPFAWWGGLNSLTATVLKLTSPGVPDFYQGARVLDDSLVDPDNRRPVDFARRLPVIEDLDRLAATDRTTIGGRLAEWLARGDFARLKLWIIQRLLQRRARQASLFDHGSYEPVVVNGPLARHVIAFLRREGDEALLVVATRLYRRAGFAAQEHDPARPPPMPWGEETLDLAALAGDSASEWRITGDWLGDPPCAPSSPAFGESISALAVGEVLARLPVAVLSLRRAAPSRTPRIPESGNSRS